MKKLLLAIFLLAGVASLNAQDSKDSAKHKMMHKKMEPMQKTDTMHHKMMKGGKMKKDSTKA